MADPESNFINKSAPETETSFAPAHRASRQILIDQSTLFEADSEPARLLNAIPDLVAILNDERQIVFANQRMKDFLGLGQLGETIGLRPGEALGCVHAGEAKHGCGTSEFCRTCGAVQSLIKTIEDRVSSEGECRISTRRNGRIGALDLRVCTVPYQHNNQTFTMLTLTDISHEKRRSVLERIFLHDLLNTVGGLKGFAVLLKEAGPEEAGELSGLVGTIVDQLISEITAHRQLLAAEGGDLEVNPSQVSASRLINDVAAAYQSHLVAEKRQVTAVHQPGTPDLVTDPTLLKRVIGNLTKNALEATRPGQAVTLTCRPGPDDSVEFLIHNPGLIPRDSQLQIFQRSYSTKGSGRGLGTYTVKLLTEQYLGGKVGFKSSAEEGTVFTVCLPRVRNPAENQTQ